MAPIKKIFFVGVSCFLALFSLSAQDIGGFWKSINEKTGKPECIVSIYQYQEKFYGRIIGTYDDKGVIDDSIYAPKSRAPGVRGNPFYSGMDILWNLSDRGARYKGKILDPEKGRVYDAELWIKGDNLVVRGELLFLGRNQVWVPAVDSDFSAAFKKPDVNCFIPEIPQVR